MTVSLLIIDDDAAIRETLVEYFETFSWTVRSAGTATTGRQMAAEHAPDVVLLDLRLPDADGIRTLDALRADDPDVAIIVLTGFADVRTAVQAMQHGAVDLLEKPVDLEVLTKAVQRAAERGRSARELEMLRARIRSDEPPARLEPTLDELITLAAQNAEAPVLLQGETGTGKGYVARQIHERSSRKSAPFVEINCASLSSTFFESELFGHERGAFTDARHAKRGLLEVAAQGTIFLDEIAELSADVQPRLLKVLEEHTFRRLGGTTTLRSAARIIGATHTPLADAVANRTFRADLYYRLQVLTLTLPPLRARPDEILPLAGLLLAHGYGGGTPSHPTTLTAAAEEALVAYKWPGNIRELKNALWRASILAQGEPIDVVHLGLAAEGSSVNVRGLPPARTLDEAERDAIRAALRAAEGNRSQAARTLGIARSTLLEKLKRYGLE